MITLADPSPPKHTGAGTHSWRVPLRAFSLNRRPTSTSLLSRPPLRPYSFHAEPAGPGKGWSFNATAPSTALPPRQVFVSRPLSLVSLAGSIPSNRSSLAGEGFRRLERDEPFMTSLQRASEALRASERSRMEEQRKVERGRTSSAHFAAATNENDQEQIYDNTINDHQHLRQIDAAFAEPNRSGRKLSKSRSIPLEMLSRPSHSSTTSDTSQTTHDYPSPANLSPPSAQVHRRVASFVHLPSPIYRRPSLLHTTRHSNFVPLPLYLPIPTEPPSKFSASTGNSQLDDFGSKAKAVEDPKPSARARTMSRAQSFRNLLSTPSKLSLRKKGSLANLFGGHSSSPSKRKEEKEKAAEFKSKLAPAPASFVSKIPRAINGSPDTTASQQTRKTPRTAFLHAAIRDLTHAKVAHLATSAGSGSTSASTSMGNRSSQASSKKEHGPKAWVSKIGRAVSGKKEKMEGSPKVLFAERVNISAPIPGPIPLFPSHLPSRIPISHVFPSTNLLRPKRAPPPATFDDEATLRARDPYHRAAIASIDTTLRAKPVPRRISAIPRAATYSGATSAPFTSLTAPPRRPLRPRSPAALLPSVELRPRPASPVPESPTTDSSTSSGGNHTPPSPSPSPNRRSFRSPSPARFRDLLPSPPASSPEKNERGLPMPEESPKSAASRTSPKKRAMGPEQAITMEANYAEGHDAFNAGISEVFGATSDLADLLSALDDTSNMTANLTGHLSPDSHVQDLSASLRHYLPKAESIESLRSTVSDVPDDLRDLIQSVDDHISDVDLDLQEELNCNDELRLPFGEEDMDTFDQEGSTLALESNGSTVSSFEGHVSTAAMALKSILDGSGSGQVEPRFLERRESVASYEESNLRDTIQEYLQMERPSVGEKMMDRMDIEVSLTSLVGACSPPPSPEESRPATRSTTLAQQHIRAESSGSVSMMSVTSPCPAPKNLRTSMVRYSQDHNRIQSRRPASAQSYSSNESDFDRSTSPVQDLTSSSLAQSSRSTNLSISSLNSSPCPGPRQRRVPMLTRNPPPLPHFRFPAPKAAKPAPWTKTSTTPEKGVAKGDSPFKKAFNPLEQFKIKSQKKSSGSEETTVNLDVQVVEAAVASSPRFVRPLQSSKQGIQRPRPFSERSTSNSLIPPDTPPPSSPSGSDHSPRSSQSSRSSFQGSFEIERQSHPPTVSVRVKKGHVKKGHVRAVSRASSLFQASIIEEELNVSPTSSPVAPRIDHGYSLVVRGLEAIEEPPLSPIGSSSSGKDEDRPQMFTLSFSPADSTTLDEYADGAEEDLWVEDDEEDTEMMRRAVHFVYEAQTELKRSKALWPDTEASLEALAFFIPPVGTFEILEFLFNSQNRYRHHLHPHSSIFNLPSPEITPAEAPSPATPELSPDYDDGPANISISPPSPSPAPNRMARLPLAAKPVNPQLALTKSTSSSRKGDALSPFTALPPKLGLKLRRLRARLSPKKHVDLAFLGPTASDRRKEQFDAARRKLEGRGMPGEQRSDEESDEDTLESIGEAFVGFVKTPKLSTSRPRVRRKLGISGLR